MRRVAALAVAFLLLGPGTAAAIQGWRLVDRATVSRALADEGIGTRWSTVYYRGNAGIPAALREAGWDRIGDTDAHDGYVFDAYTSSSRAMFLVTTPSDESTLHEVEQASHSFVTVSPDGQWLVAGSLAQAQELLVYPAPVVNPAFSGRAVARILLNRPVRDLQGCDFLDGKRLVCGTSDPFNDLYPSSLQFLQIDLSRAVRGRDVQGRVRFLGQVPLDGGCAGEFVTEGVDYDPATELLRLSVNRPPACADETAVYTFRR